MPDATVVIVTRNRKELASVAVESALAQDGDVEVLVVDDASTDGTAEYLRQRFPRAIVQRSERHLGYIVHRAAAAASARSPILFSLDDDAYFLEPGAVRQTLALFDDARVGAVAIQHVNRSVDGSESRAQPDVADDGGVYLIERFIGTAYAVRRDLFQALGGFNGYLYHWAEESEFSQRLVAHGYYVRLGTRALIRHCPQPAKYVRSMTRYIYRNRILAVWFNAPAAYLLPLLLAQTGRTLMEIVRQRKDPLTLIGGLAMGWASIFGGWRLRRPLPKRGFDFWLYVRKHPAIRADRVPAEIAVEPTPFPGLSPVAELVASSPDRASS